MPSPTPIKIPRENVNDDTATLVVWHVADGARVERGRSVAQVETSKAVIEIEATEGGIIRHAVAAGSEVPIGATIATVELGADRPSGPLLPAPGADRPLESDASRPPREEPAHHLNGSRPTPPQAMAAAE